MTPDELEAIKKQTEKWLKIISDNSYLNYGGLPDDLAALDKAIDLYRPLIMEVQHLQAENERLRDQVQSDPLAQVPAFDWGPEGEPKANEITYSPRGFGASNREKHYSMPEDEVSG